MNEGWQGEQLAGAQGCCGAVCQLSALVQVMHPPALFVTVAGGWPASLISVLALKLPLWAAFFPKDHHRCFKSKTQVTSWTSVVEFSAASITSDVGP
jgi:hypothetical protein